LKDLHKLILEGKVIFKSNNNSYISNEAKDLILNLLKVDPKERINIDEILNHPWMINANNNNIDDEKNINLFTKAETVLLSKENIDYRNEDNNGMMVENFTLKNLDTLKEIENKDVNTKSVILAPFNTSYENDEIDKLNNIDIKNDIIDFNENAKVLNRMYELNNNVEIDHGVLKNKSTSSSNDNNNNNDNNKDNNNKNKNNNNDNNKNNNNIEEDDDNNGSVIINDNYDNISDNNNKYINNLSPLIKDNNKQDSHRNNSSLTNISTALIDETALKIMENFGYKKDYLQKCLNNNELNYATATYYLVSNINE
jgi:hypothetical protein